MSVNVQYGCGLSAPDNWINFDSSPTLRLQKIPLFGRLVTKVKFPVNVRYGDVLKGLPGIQMNSCDAIYCSHVLEHLSYEDCKLALKNTYLMLKPGGRFRCVVPDLAFAIMQYLQEKNTDRSMASIHFMETTLMGCHKRPKTLQEKIISTFGNSHHLWMWDEDSLIKELNQTGFKSVKPVNFNDSENKSFLDVEEISRFWGAIAIESVK